MLEKILNFLNVKFSKIEYEILICPHCKTDVPKTLFCGNCGEYLLHCENISEYYVLDCFKCCRCSETVPISKFCGKCGERMI